MQFNYQTRNKEGQIQTGTVEASSREAAIILLQKQGLYITLLEEIGGGAVYTKKITIFESISRKDIVLFSRQLSIMFKSKVPLVEALEVLSVQTKSTNFKETCSLIFTVRKSEADKAERIFNELYKVQLKEILE